MRWGWVTACFFAGYILVVARLRARYGTGIVMFNSTVIFTVLLLPLALTQKVSARNAVGLGDVGGMRAGGAGAGTRAHIAYALAHLRPTFSSLGLLIQTLGAATSAWVVLGERFSAIQIVGGVVIVGGIAMARSARKGGGAGGNRDALKVRSSQPPWRSPAAAATTRGATGGG